MSTLDLPDRSRGRPGTRAWIKSALREAGYEDVSVEDFQPGTVTIVVRGVREWWWVLTLGVRARRERRRMSEILDHGRPAGAVYAYKVV